MKKTIIFSSLLCIMMSILSCSKEFVEQHEQITDPIQSEDYDSRIIMFAEAVNKAVRHNPEFRKLIKSEVLKQRDGDYDMLISHVAANTIEVSDTYMTKGGVREISVKDMISMYYPDDVMTRASEDPVDELLSRYPDLQISVPVHADEWNEKEFVPNIAIIPSDYEDLVTQTVPGIDSEGNPITVDAINEPDEPYIVVGLSERADTLSTPTIIDTLFFEADPIKIEPIVKANAKYVNNTVEITVALNHLAISKLQTYHIKYYDVYRADFGTTDYVLIESGLLGMRTCIDRTVMPDKEYSYKVETVVESGITRRTVTSILSVVTRYDIPSPVSDFTVQNISSSRTELKWTNNPDESYKTVIYRTTPEQTREKIATLDANTDIYYDTDVTPGEKWSYEIRKIDETTGIESTAEYGYTYNPYRNPEGPSRVMLRKIHVNSKEVEGWLAGRPEFYISVYGMDTEMNITKLGSTLDVRFSKDQDDSQDLYGLLHNWSYFNDLQYYPALNFNMIEYDRESGTLDLTVTAKAGVKYKEYISLDAVGTYNLHYEHKDKDCGCASILYFENPSQTIPLQSYGASITISE